MCVESLVQVAIGHVSIHATRCRVAKLISRNYWKRKNKRLALREPLYS